MMNDFRCYTRDELRDFLLGNVAGEISFEITAHLDRCDACEETVVGLESTSDDLLKLIQVEQCAGTGVNSSSQSNFIAPEPVYKSNGDFQDALLASQQVFNEVIKVQQEFGDGALSQPSQIGDYEIVSTIARGGMGSVYLARHMHLEKEVAIKILPERKMRSPDAIARFSREMKIIGQMSHPSMVSATDAGSASGIHYLVMELVDGVDLGQLVRQQSVVRIADACELVRQAAIGMQYAHEKGVVHRDVKPSNLMLVWDTDVGGKERAVVKILDLGLATLSGLNGVVDELTTVGQLMGTLDYMAPEQCGSPNEVDASADIYAMGATLYKLVSGFAPYSNPLHDSPLKKLKAMAVSEPVPIIQRLSQSNLLVVKNQSIELREGLSAVIERCLARDPASRYGSASDLALALEPLAKDHKLESVLKHAMELRQSPSTGVDRREDASLARQTGRAKRGANGSTPATDGSQISAAAPVLAKPQTSGLLGRFIGACLMLALFGFSIWGGIVVVVNSTTGQLVIESEVDDIEVSVMKSDESTSEVKVTHGSKTTRLWAGQYRIEIKGDSDGLVVDGDNFTLTRGQTVVARIKRSEANAKQVRQIAVSETTAIPGKNDPEKPSHLALRLLDLEMNLAIVQDRGDEDPGVMAFEKLIDETRSRIDQGLVKENYYEEELFKAKLKKAEMFSLQRGGVSEGVVAQYDRRIEVLQRYVRERGVDDVSRTGLPLNSSEISDPSKLGSPTVAPELSLQGAPTYQGKNAYAIIEVALSNEEDFYVHASQVGISKLERKLSGDQKKAVVSYFAGRYESEVSFEFHLKLTRLLSFLARDAETLNLVCDHLENATSNLSAEEIVRSASGGYMSNVCEALFDANRQEASSRMLDSARSKEAGKQAIGIGFAFWLAKRVEASKSKSRSDYSAALSDDWKEPLLIAIKSPTAMTAVYASWVLAQRFGDDDGVGNAVLDAAGNERENGDTVLAANIDYLLDRNKEDEALAIRFVSLVGEYVVTHDTVVGPREIVRTAMKRLVVDDDRIAREISKQLMNSDWAMSQTRGVDTFRGSDSLKVEVKIPLRYQVIAEIGEYKHDAKSFFVPALRQQFEFGWGPDKIATESQKSGAYVYLSAREAIQKVLDAPDGFLVDGRDAEDWLERFRSAESEEEQIRSLRAMQELQASAKDADEFVMEIVNKVREGNIDLVFKDGSFAHAAAQACARIGRTRFHGTILKNLDLLKDADASFVFAILLHSKAEAGRTSIQYVSQFLESKDPAIQRRALFTMMLLNVRNSFNSSLKQKSILVGLKSDSLSKQSKTELLSEFLRSKTDSTGRLRSRTDSDGHTEAIQEFLRNVDSSSGICSLLNDAEQSRPNFVEPFLARLLAENESLLQESYRPVDYDWWNEEELPVQELDGKDGLVKEPVKVSIMQRLIEVLDARRQASTRVLRFVTLKEEKEKAIETLKAYASVASGPTKRRLDRILSVLRNEE